MTDTHTHAASIGWWLACWLERTNRFYAAAAAAAVVAGPCSIVPPLLTHTHCSRTYAYVHTAIYKVGYLALLAWLRILVLLLPLLFHSYTGTALPCHVVYMGWYTLTFTVVLLHMLALLLLNPESMEALVPEPEGFLADLHLYRRLWYTLLLSVLAHACHFVLVQHVKSTAPPNVAGTQGWYNRTGGSGGGGSATPPVSLYFAIRANPVLQDEPALVHAMGGTFETLRCDSSFVLRVSPPVLVCVPTLCVSVYMPLTSLSLSLSLSYPMFLSTRQNLSLIYKPAYNGRNRNGPNGWRTLRSNTIRRGPAVQRPRVDRQRSRTIDHLPSFCNSLLIKMSWRTDSWTKYLPSMGAGR